MKWPLDLERFFLELNPILRKMPPVAACLSQTPHLGHAHLTRISHLPPDALA